MTCLCSHMQHHGTCPVAGCGCARYAATLTLTLDQDTVTNAARNSRGSWHPQREASRTIRETVEWTAKGLAMRPPGVPVDIRVEQRSRTAHHRDSDNVSGPAKAIIDGLVDAGVLVEDCPCHVWDVTLRQHNGCADVEAGVHEFTVTLTEAHA